MNKSIINQDVLLRTPITQVRRHIDDGRPEDTARQLRVVVLRYMKKKETNCSNNDQHVPHQENIYYLIPRT
jgi:hypothetical protein